MITTNELGFSPAAAPLVDAWTQQLRTAGWRATAREWEQRFGDRVIHYLTIYVFDSHSGEGWELRTRRDIANVLNHRPKRYRP